MYWGFQYGFLYDTGGAQGCLYPCTLYFKEKILPLQKYIIHIDRKSKHTCISTNKQVRETT